jgi:hypothetical protein
VIEVKVNGKPFTPQTFEDEVIRMATEQLREQLGAIRHPETGEFPTIAVTANGLDDMQVQIEGSPELLALVRQRLGIDEQEDTVSEPSQPATTPKVFLSYAFEDSDLARRIAEKLQANGIDTWWAEWCITAGDSIRQRIDEGLTDCTHFVVLLTQASVKKPWVNQEMDAGLIRKLNGKAKFIPVRCDLQHGELPPLLQPLLSPAVDAMNLDVVQLINDIHGVSKKPPLGPAPHAAAKSASATGFSAAANAVAKLYVETSKCARKFDPHYTAAELAEKLSLSEEDVLDAVHELKGLVTTHRANFIHAEDELFPRLDKFWMPWDPADDAVAVATGMLNDEDFPNDMEGVGARFGWEPRRLNAAMAFLVGRDLVRGLKAMNSGPWLLVAAMKTDATRRFVKSRA